MKVYQLCEIQNKFCQIQGKYILDTVSSPLTNALCVRLNRKWELGIFTKMSTSPLIFLKLNYFRHNYLEIVLCSVSLLMHIWVQVEHSLLCRQIYI